MKRSTLIQDLAIRYKYLNHDQVERMVELVFKHLSNALAQDQRIEIRGIGTWHIKTRSPRTARNPRTGEKVQVGIKDADSFILDQHGSIIEKIKNRKEKEEEVWEVIRFLESENRLIMNEDGTIQLVSLCFNKKLEVRHYQYLLIYLYFT